MSFILLGILNSQVSGISETYWMATLGGAGTDTARGIAIDSSNNLYVCGAGSSTGAGGDDAYLFKYDSNGNVLWQRYLYSATSQIFYGVATDASDNVFVAGYSQNASPRGNDQQFAKYNSEGTLLWQRELYQDGSDISFASGTDSSGNVYFAGGIYRPSPGYPEANIVKYNTSGTIQWQRMLGTQALEDEANALFVDSSHLYIAGPTDSEGAGGFDFLIAKYDLDGTIAWQRILGGASRDEAQGVTADSSGNVYVVGDTQSTGAGGRDVLIAKYNSSGTIQWQRSLGGAGSDFAYSVTTDASDNVYLAGYTASDGEGSNDILIAKYNSSGTIQWQRTIGAASSSQGFGIEVVGNALYVVGNTQSTGEGSTDVFIAKLPIDGSLTGTYTLDGVGIVYAESTLTDSSSSLTAATSTLTDTTSSLTDAASSLTAGTATLTAHYVEVI